MKTKLRGRIAAIVIVVAALGAAGATAANAAPSTCSSGRVCVYDNINFGTQLGWRLAGFPLQDVSSGNNDLMSSWSNNSIRNACWYTNANGGGVGLQMNQYTDNKDVGVFWNDIMSSWKGQSC